jgi:hypothetical protein
MRETGVKKGPRPNHSHAYFGQIEPFLPRAARELDERA